MLHGMGDCTPALHCGCLTPSGLRRYVVGFALDEDGRVALIRKNRPEWQAGLLNGIGGRVEPGEASDAAMRREFREETGCTIALEWDLIVTMGFLPESHISFYRARTTAAVLDSLRTTTDEEVCLVWPGTNNWHLMIPNLSWLIPLAAYTADRYDPIHVTASVVESLGREPRCVCSAAEMHCGHRGDCPERMKAFPSLPCCHGPVHTHA